MKEQKHVHELFISKYIFFLESDFCRITPKCFNPNSKEVLQLFIAIENGALALETEEQIKLNKNKIRFDLWLSDLARNKLRGYFRIGNHPLNY